ncbi:MAG: pentapeptide repeat-containing protein [Anaerolineales bacterium]|nr:pentapeptide repeat-containing protein [Anaerolineales bacterium]
MKQTRKKRRRRHINLVPIVGVILGLAGFILAFGGHWQQYGRFDLQQFKLDFYANAGSELIGIAITVVLIDTLYQRREQRQYKAQLIRDLQTRDNGVAHRTMRELREHGWHADGSLRDHFLNYANLESVYLVRTDFTDCRLHRANFTGAWLRGVNLTGANLTGANFAAVHQLKPRQLLSAYKLAGSTMPDGQRYDGRFNLAGDFELAVRDAYDLNDPESMARFYRVPLATYLYWQQNPMLEIDSYWEDLIEQKTGERKRPYHAEDMPELEAVEQTAEAWLFIAGSVLTLLSGTVGFLLSWFIQGKQLEKHQQEV